MRPRTRNGHWKPAKEPATLAPEGYYVWVQETDDSWSCWVGGVGPVGHIRYSAATSGGVPVDGVFVGGPYRVYSLLRERYGNVRPLGYCTTLEDAKMSFELFDFHKTIESMRDALVKAP